MSRFVFLLILLFAQLIQSDEAGDAHFSVVQLRPLVGEPVALSLIVTLQAGSVVTAWPEFPLQWADFEIEDVGELTITETGNGRVEYRQTIRVRLWEPGDYETPETVITYQLPGEGVATDLIVSPAFFTVPSVLTSDDESLSPAKPPVYLAYLPLWLVVIALFFLTAGAMVGINYWQSRYRRRLAARAKDIDIYLLGQRTLAVLQKIDYRTTEPAAVYDLVADRIRGYLRDHFGVAASEMTTSELLNMLQYELPEPLLSRLQQLLGQADLVKFARQRPDHDSAQRYLEAAIRWLQVTMREQGERSESGGEAA